MAYSYWDEHSPRSPSYRVPKTFLRCAICGDGIYEGEEYIDNGNESVHFECIPDMMWLLNWLGYDIKEMNDFDEYRD